MKSILYVSYPLLPVSDESAGGAEQMLATLEREMDMRGYRTTVAACEGSRIAGELVATGFAAEEPDSFEPREIEHHVATVAEICRRSSAPARAAFARPGDPDTEGSPFDLVHDESGSFWRCAAAFDVPVLATLHLPRSFYRPELFNGVAPNVYFNCVSAAQLSGFAGLPRMMGVVPNGIPLDRFPFTTQKRNYLLWMGRICEEKGTHVAIEVAALAGLPLVLAGQIYPFSYHQKYYDQRVRPHLGEAGSQVRFVDTPMFDEKVRLLRHARALLVPSLANETSSLASLEAMACGTPVIAFRRGALPEIVSGGETGLIVDTPEQMTSAVEDVGAIEPWACRERVEQHYSAQRMADDYERLYARVIAEHAGREARAA